jgi:hypothetical protein
VPVPHARAAVSSLLVMLADITDPRDPRGARHPLVAVHTAAITTGRDLVAAEPGHIAEERGHGRINRWTTWTTHTGPTAWARTGLPHATRLALIRRDVAGLAGQPLSKPIVFVATSRAGLTAAEISTSTRRHWGIENLEHRPRDTLWREDDQQAHGNSPRAMATLRNAGPRPVRHPRHHHDQTDRPADRPQPAPRRPTDHIASHPAITAPAGPSPVRAGWRWLPVLLL